MKCEFLEQMNEDRWLDLETVQKTFIKECRFGSAKHHELNGHKETQWLKDSGKSSLK